MTVRASELWESPVTHQKYPTEYVIRIPSLETRLEVTVVRADQEIVSQMPRNMGGGYARGRYQHLPVTGHVHLENVGNFM